MTGLRVRPLALAVWLPMVLAVLLWGFAANPARAAVPTTTAVEGLLLSTANGAPAADGDYSATFAVYAAATGGAPLWSEGPLPLAVAGGRFSVALGSKVPISAAELAKSPALWLGLQVASDPELPRQPWHSVALAMHAATADALACSGCVGSAQLSANALQGYAKSADLAAYALASSLGAYAKQSDLGAYAKQSDLAEYAKQTDLSGLASKASLAKVATSGDYLDLKNLPALPKLGASCGTGLVVRGLKADGSLDCGNFSISAKDLPRDGLDEISNGVLTTQFADTVTSSATPLKIPDFTGAGITDTLATPDLGLAEAITLTVNVTNSNVAKVRIDLYDPSGSPTTIYNGEKTGTKLSFTATSAAAPLSAWVGKPIKGVWSLVVADLSNGPTNPDGTLDSWSLAFAYNAGQKAQVNGNLAITGTITGNAAQYLVPAGAVMAFNLKACPAGWTELVAARGRTIVGLPSGGVLGAQVGTALADQENRATGKHGHAIADPGHSHPFKIDSDTGYDGGSGAPAGEDSGVYTVSTSAATTGISVQDSGSVAGTNAPYLQLLMCQKQ
ncbi:MAG: proprotein convertase P-domain-containing protein [Deltaproteobacteria bacterium]|nr:proprotein convertase P-domain-containing protein [Deltaproteobacteria bacterium]